jgi:hypothetical protein
MQQSLKTVSKTFEGASSPDRAGLVQSVWRLAAGWMTVIEFKSQWGQEFSLYQVVQTGSGAHPASI